QAPTRLTPQKSQGTAAGGITAAHLATSTPRREGSAAGRVAPGEDGAVATEHLCVLLVADQIGEPVAVEVDGLDLVRAPRHRRAHLDEAEAARPSGVTVGDDRGGRARPHLREERLKVRARRVEGEVPHEYLLAHRLTLLAPHRAVSNFVAVAEREPNAVGTDATDSRTNKRTSVSMTNARDNCNRARGKFS